MSRSICKETSSFAFGMVGRFGGGSAGFVVAALNAASAASREVVVLRVLSAGILCPLARLHFLKPSGQTKRRQKRPLFDHLLCASEHRRWHVEPSALAVFRLITSSYLFGACTGRSAGFSPLRMRSTYSPHSRYQLWIAAGHRRRQANSLDAPRQCSSGYLLMNPSRLGIFTLGKVSAFIASFSPIILLSARI